MDAAIGLVVQARMGSSRLPGKVLLDLCGKPILSHVLERLGNLPEEYERIIITSSLRIDDVIEDFCRKKGVLFFRGSESDVLDRYFKAARLFRLQHIVRLTADNPLVDADNLQFLIEEHLMNNADYSSNKSEVDSGLPEGVGCEVFSFSALERSWREAKKENHREHVNEYILENQGGFRVLPVKARAELSVCGDLRLTVDTEEDFRFVEYVVGLLYVNNLEINLQNICELRRRGCI